MKRLLFVAVLSFISVWVNAQFTVRLIVTEAATRKGDDYYLAGDFNKWNPGDYNFKLKPFGAVRRIYVLKIYPPASLLLNSPEAAGIAWNQRQKEKTWKTMKWK